MVNRSFYVPKNFTFFRLQILSRSKPAQPAGSEGAGASAAKEKKKKRLPKLEDFVQARDYVGAITLLEVSRRAAPSDQSERNATGNSETQPAPPPLPAQFLRSTERGSGGDTALWLAYCCFHNGDYARARKVMYEGQQCPQFHSGRLSAGV